MLVNPSAKITLDGNLERGSNKRKTRLCMSEGACLIVVNFYASARDCTLTPGAATTPDSNAQCTAVFPGSRGTCKNATVLSDQDIATILVEMARQ